MASRKSPKEKKPAGPKPLTLEQQAFVDEYILDPNATQAYRRAYPGCTYRTAGTEGHRFLKNPVIAAEIKAARHAQQQRTRITADRVLRELARVAFSDIGDLFSEGGTLSAARMIPLEARKAIGSVRVRKEKTTVRSSGRTTTTENECEVEYKFWPKVEALKSLCNHLGLTTEITPLDALLATLPAGLAATVRSAIAGTLPEGSGTSIPPAKRAG